jgi:hypothetical protein
VPIPEFIEPSGYLPPGRYLATWTEIVDRFSTNPHRTALSEMLLEALRMLAKAGCRQVWINGSYVTDKERPGDVDVLYDAWAVRPNELDQLFRSETAAARADRNKIYGGDYFPVYDDELDGALISHFETDRSDIPKGIVQLSLSTLSKDGHDS